jgi:hypothetical protein
MQSSTRQKVEFYSGARFDTFLPSASALPMPPVQWIDPNATQRSQSTPSSPIPKNSISATKSIDIAAVFASTPSANGREQPKMTGKTTNNVNGNKQILKSNSYPGEKMLRNKFDQQQQQQSKKVVKNNNKIDYKGQKPRNQNNRTQQQQQKEKPTAATSKTFISTAATSVNSTTSTITKPEIPAKKPAVTSTVPQSPVSGKDISLNLMAMLGVTPAKSPPKRVEEKKSPGYDYEFFATRPGSPEKYKEITNNLKLLLKVQA